MKARAGVIVAAGLVSLAELALLATDARLGYGIEAAAAVVVLTACSWVMHRTVGVFRVRHLTIPGFWYATYLAMIVAPAYFVFAAEASESRYAYISAVHATPIAVTVGVLLVTLLSRFRRAEVDRYFAAPVAGRRGEASAFAVLLVGLGACIAAAVSHVREVPTIPLLYLLQNPGDAATVGLLREDSFKLLDTPLAYLYTWVGALFLPFACMASLGFYLLSRRRRWLGLFLVALASGLLYGAMTVAKAPVATLVLLLLLFVYMYRRGRVGRVGVLAPVLVLLYPLAVVMASYWEELTLYEAADALFNRMFYLPARVLFWYFELFPPASLGGRTSQNLAWLMGWKHFDIENYVGIHGLGYQGSVSANGAFIGYLHADFGWLGVLGGGVAAGVIMQACQVYLVRRVKTVSSLAVYAYLMLAFWYLHSTGLPIVLVSRGVFVVLLLPALFELATGIVQRISGSSPPAVRIPGLARSLRDARG